MKKYISFFRIRFVNGLQYRMAALAGISTQFVWGILQLLIFKAFYQVNATAFPMSFSALSSYIWLQQAFLTLFVAYVFEDEIFSSIEKGDVAYELCRPINLYAMWFMRTIAYRLSKACLRAIPVLLVASILPEPYALHLPKSWQTFVVFLLSMILALWVVAASTMIIYLSGFFTISTQGIKIVYMSLVEFASGAIIPLPFMTDTVRKICEFLPFASMQNAPLRIYSGDLSGTAMLEALLLQCVWGMVLTLSGYLMSKKGIKKTVIQGG